MSAAMSNADDAFSLSHAQRVLWAGQALAPDRPLYNMALSFEIRGAIDPSRFRRALQNVLARADALRTYIVDGPAEPRQAVAPPSAPPVVTFDLTSASDPAAAADDWMVARTEERIDLRQTSFSTALLKLADDRWRWFFLQHHLLTDAWSMSLIFRRVEQAYRLDGEDLSERPQFRASVEAEQQRASSAYEAARTFWRDQPHPDPNLRLYGSLARDMPSRSARLRRAVSQDRTERLLRLITEPEVRALSRDMSVMQLYAVALFTYLRKVSGERRLSIALPVHSRATARARDTIGLFIELYPASIEFEPSDTFRTAAAKVRASLQQTFRYALPGASSVQDLRSTNVVLNFINVAFGRFAGFETSTEWIHPGHVDPGHALRLQVHRFTEGGDWQLYFDVNEAIDDADGAHRVPDQFFAVFDAMVEDFDRRIDEVALPTPTRRIVGPVEDRDNSTVLRRFEAQVDRQPEATAVRDADRALSFEALRRASQAVATQLRRTGVERGDRVGLLMTRSVDSVVGILGILYAGAAYVPLHPETPPLRLRQLLDDGEPTAILTCRADAAMAPVADRPLVFVEEVPEEIDLSRLGGGPDSNDVAYVLYTSGSTGRPKGVLVTHEGLDEYVAWASGAYAFPPQPTFALHSALTFDLTVTSLFVPLATGGTISVYPEVASTGDLSVLESLTNPAIDVVKLTPSHLRLAIDSLRQRASTPAARRLTLIVGGEALDTGLARAAYDALDGQVAIFNEYGPTEAVVGNMIHRFDRARDTGAEVPIGRPAANTELHLLDEGGHPVPPRVPGELYIARRGLALGYLARPEETAARFLPHPTEPTRRLYRTGDRAMVRDDGVVEFLGRFDDQLKVSGIRVEPAEIEHALADHPDIQRAVVRLATVGADDPLAVRCTRCGIPASYPDITIEASGECNICTAYGRYRDRVAAYFKDYSQLEAIVRDAATRAKGDYDLLLLLSGGKDSTYALVRLVETGARVLTATLDNGYISDSAKANIVRVTGELGVDHEFFSTPNMNAIFTDSLERFHNVCQGCFKAIYTLGTQLAHDRGIPVVVTGLSRGQMFETRLSPALFEGRAVDADDIDAMVLETRKAYHRADDGTNRWLDTRIFRDEALFDEIQYVDFYRYCDVSLDELLATLKARVPWVRPQDTGRSTNCLINEVGIFVHKKKTGFHNYALPYSWDVRLGHKTRQQAVQELNDKIDSAKVFKILDEVGFVDDSLSARSDAARLVAYFTAQRSLPPAEVRDWLRQRLPRQLVPHELIELDRFELTRNGKVDYEALPSPQWSQRVRRHDYVPPHGDVETSLASVWAAALRTPRVGRNDNFFDLGGDSIAALQIVARSADVGLAITAGELLRHQTIAKLAPVTRRLEPMTPASTPGPSGLDKLDDRKKAQLSKLLAARRAPKK